MSHSYLSLSADAWCACGKRSVSEISCTCGGLARAVDALRGDIGRALELELLAEPECPQCGTQLDGYRWSREGDRHRCYSCTGNSGLNFIVERPPTAAEHAAVPGLRAVMLDARVVTRGVAALRNRPSPRVWLDVDKAAFIAGTGAALTTEELALAARSTDAALRRRVVHHAAVTPELLTLLANDPEPLIRLAVAGHEATTAPALASLAHDEDLETRIRVARHARTPAAVLEALAQDASAKLRLALARRADTPEAVLLGFVDGADKPMLQALAGRDWPIEALTARLKALGFALKQPKPDPYGAAYDPQSGLTFEEWLRAVDDSYRR